MTPRTKTRTTTRKTRTTSKTKRAKRTKTIICSTPLHVGGYDLNPWAWSPGAARSRPLGPIERAAFGIPAPRIYELTPEEHAQPLRRCPCCRNMMPRTLFKPVCVGCFAEIEHGQGQGV